MSILIGVRWDYLISCYSWESEGFDREHMKLPGISDRLVSEVLKANPNTIVVNQSGTPVEMPWEAEAHTLLQVCLFIYLASFQWFIVW